MLVYPLSHLSWQVLRAALRSKKPPTGLELRVVPNRVTKDGTFLDKLVGDGLLEVVVVEPLPKGATDEEKRRPAQFRTRYKLTEKGRRAADFGEFEREWKPAAK
jgi:hypothetical protein